MASWKQLVYTSHAKQTEKLNKDRESDSPQSSEDESMFVGESRMLKAKAPTKKRAVTKPAAHKSSSKLNSGKSLADLLSQEAMNAAPGSRPKSLWQSDLSEIPRVQAVKTLEEAAEHGDGFMIAATQCLKDARQHIPTVKHRIDRHMQVYKERRECQMHVGFLGGSGTGKSSVINALLGEKNLLPVSDEAASTAVIVEISYNHNDAPEELEELYEDKAKWDSDVEEGEEVDTEIMRRIQDTVSKYKCVFPELQSVEDWTRTSVNKLLSRDGPRYLMDQKRIIETGNLEEFARLIKPFIDTSKQKDGTVSVSNWPLVKVVRLFTRSSILKAGIVFVDLPGVHDTSAARNAISRRHMKNLDISCVLSPSVRAATDQGANKILNSVQKRGMQFDGLFNANSLFFVISKIDDSLDVDRYINDHPELKSKLTHDLEHLRNRQVRLAEVEHELKELDSKHARGVKNLAKLDAEIGNNKVRADTTMTRQATASQKRKRGVDDEPTLTMPTLSQAQYARIHVERDHNKIKEITEMYEAGRRELGDEEVTKPLQVFCVSAQAFRFLSIDQQDKALQCGFFTKNDTGIPRFRDALIATTWETRLRNARAFNEEVANAARLLDIWSADTIADFKMLTHERAIVETRLDEMYGALERESDKLNLETSNAIGKLFEDELYPHLDDAADDAHTEQKKLVTAMWIQGMRWNTFRATNKRLGVWLPRGAETAIDWNEDMNKEFLDLLLPFWEDTLHKKLPALQKPYDDKIKFLIADFVELALGAADDISSTIRDSFENIKDDILGHRRRLKQGADSVFDDIHVASKEIWRLVKLECEETWEEVYEKCGDESGPDMFKRSKKAHKVHVLGDGGLVMYNNASAKMQEAFEKAFKEVSDNLRNNFTESLDAIKKEFIDVLEHHTAAGTRHNSRRVPSKLKINLRNALEPHFKQLYKA
ncbi:hypothetical protein EAF04_006381 [Stromatinia cepivora]|nr:hypothetical protein EAF04_006381 [Stromatinia cepivora]